MSGTTDEVPDETPYRLDEDVTDWLYALADQDYGGDVELALNEALHVVMEVSIGREDPWAAIERRQAGRLPRARGGRYSG